MVRTFTVVHTFPVLIRCVDIIECTSCCQKISAATSKACVGSDNSIHEGQIILTMMTVPPPDLEKMAYIFDIFSSHEDKQEEKSSKNQSSSKKTQREGNESNFCIALSLEEGQRRLRNFP